jgi:HSP20 family protein
MTWEKYMPVLFRDTAFDTQIDRLFDDALRAVGDWTSMWAPDCNVYEDDHSFVVQAALPGIDPGSIDVRVEKGTLYLKGERKSGQTGNCTWYAHEVKDGPFACSFTLPSTVDHDKSTASYKQGMLTITFPKLEEAKPRRIMIECQSS